jgi:hypothetical protein
MIERGVRRYEAAMSTGDLSPLRALAVAGLGAAAVHVGLMGAVLGGIDGLGPYAISQTTPWGLLDRFAAPLCLVPLAAALPAAAVFGLFLAAGLAWPLLSAWTAHPYDAGTWPGLPHLDVLAGMPFVLLGCGLAVLARREPSGGARIPAAPRYAALVTSTLALAALGLALAAVDRGVGVAEAGALASAALFWGALGGAAFKGTASGLAILVLLGGLPATARAGAFAVAVLVAGPLPALWARGGHLGAADALWLAGAALYGLASLSPTRRHRRPEARTVPA